MNRDLGLGLEFNSIGWTNVAPNITTIIANKTALLKWRSVQRVLGEILFKWDYNIRHILSLSIVAFALSGVALAQKTHQPKKVEGVQYYKVEYHRFKPGKVDEGRAFIRKYYRPADSAAGIDVLEFTPITGEWDWIAFFPVEADFLAWERSPMSLRARAKFEEMVGGPENAKKLDKEFNDLIQELRIEIMARDIKK